MLSAACTLLGGVQQDQHDPDALLGLVLRSLEGPEQQACARALHRASLGGRTRAYGVLHHLSLLQYDQGRSIALHLIRNPHLLNDPTAFAALASIAASPPIPYSLMQRISAAGCLSSLQIRAAQAEHLLDSSTTAAAAAAAAASATGGSGLAATLAGLRCLSVELEPGSMRHVGRLVGSCSGLTKLELTPKWVHRGINDTPLVEGLAAAAAAAAAGCGGGASGSCQLPPLQHLGIYCPLPGFLTYWMGRPQAAALTTLCFGREAYSGVDISSLAACSHLRELVLPWRPVRGEVSGAEMQSPSLDELTQLTSLTKLVMDDSNLEQGVPPAVWALTQLRHLSLRWCRGRLEVPPEISSLKQLTCLDTLITEWYSSASQLAAWLPQLEVLVMHCSTKVGPQELTGLTRLTALSCSVTSAAAMDSLGQLTEAHLNVWRPYLAPPLTPLGRLSALEVLNLAVEEGAVALGPCLLPSLVWLHLTADNPAHVAHQLLGPALHLTHLRLGTSKQQQVGAVLQLGMLPVLEELDCGWVEVVGAGPWLQQHPHLTSLHIRAPSRTAAGLPLPQLPPHLQHLCLHGNINTTMCHRRWCS